MTDQAVCNKLRLNNAQYVARINTEFQKVKNKEGEVEREEIEESVRRRRRMNE